MKVALDEDRFGRFRIWKEPAPNREYVVGVDTAEGKVRDRPAFARASLLYRDAKPDFSAAVVIERETGRHCATWHGDIEVTEWSYVVAAIGYFYNTAWLVPEVNSSGNEVVNTLAKRVHYPNLYRNLKPHVTEGDDLTPKWGWFTNDWNRNRLFARGAEILRADPHFTRDKDLVDEIRTIEIDENGRARAKHPNKDDIVMAWLLALQARWEWLTGEIGRAPDEQDPLEALPPDDREVWRQWQARCDRLPGQHDSHRGRRFARSGLVLPRRRVGRPRPR